MADIFEKCVNWKDADLAKLAGHYAYYRVIQETDGTEVLIDGKRVIMACSNNYLGLANDPRVKEAAAEASRKWGASTCGSRVLNGTTELHDELDHKLAEYLGREAAVTYSTGFGTNVGVLSSLILRKDTIFADRMVHASLVEGIQAALGDCKRFRHNNMDDLERLLASADPESGKLIVVDGMYSMEGDLANLPKIVELKEKYGARLFVDDAHGFGVLGEGGRGSGEHFGLHDQVDLQMLTFSKSLASIGGCIAGPKEVINWLKHKSRPLVFSASMTPGAAAAALKSLEIIKAEPERRARLWDISERFHRELRGMGFDTSPSVTPVVPVVIGDQTLCLAFWRRLTDAGMFASPVVKPAVEKELVRTVYTATHTDAQIDRSLEIFQRCGREMGIIPYKRPSTRVEVKMARPGCNGFYSSAEDGITAISVERSPVKGSLGVGEVLQQAGRPLGERISDAMEIVTWRALNAGPEDVKRLAELPSTLWQQRRRLRTKLMGAGVKLLQRRQAGARSAERE